MKYIKTNECASNSDYFSEETRLIRLEKKMIQNKQGNNTKISNREIYYKNGRTGKDDNRIQTEAKTLLIMLFF